MFKVLIPFTDKAELGAEIYRAGDTYPKKGRKPEKAWLERLQGSENNFGRPVIREAADVPLDKMKPEELEVLARDLGIDTAGLKTGEALTAAIEAAQKE